MEMQPPCQRISLVSIPFVLVSSGKTTPREPFWTTVIAETLWQMEVGDRLAQQSLSPGYLGIENGKAAMPSRSVTDFLRTGKAEGPICTL
jgi:hypothetical protein